MIAQRTIERGTARTAGTVETLAAHRHCKQKKGEVALAAPNFLKYATVEADVVALDSVHKRVAMVICGDVMHRLPCTRWGGRTVEA